MNIQGAEIRLSIAKNIYKIHKESNFNATGYSYIHFINELDEYEKLADELGKLDVEKQNEKKLLHDKDELYIKNIQTIGMLTNEAKLKLEPLDTNIKSIKEQKEKLYNQDIENQINIICKYFETIGILKINHGVGNVRISILDINKLDEFIDNKGYTNEEKKYTENLNINKQKLINSKRAIVISIIAIVCSVVIPIIIKYLI